MRTETNHLLAVGLFGNQSGLRGRIEILLRDRRSFSPRASIGNIATGTAALSMFALAVSLAPHWIAFAQQPTREAFEVTSVKANTSGERQITLEASPNGKLNLKNLPLIVTIALAYNLPLQGTGRVTGAPEWVSRDRFDIEATPPDGAFPPSLGDSARDAKFRAMIRSLLADRFKLAIHSDSRIVPVYAIVTGKGGPKLELSRTQEKDCPTGQSAMNVLPRGDVSCHTFNGGQGRGAHSQAANIADLALFVSNWTDRPVVDKSGLKDLYKIDTQPWIPMSVGPPPADGAKGETGAQLADLPTIFSVFESLGLKLESQQAPLEYFVIDHVEKPDAN